jgi:hypothetical protein
VAVQCVDIRSSGNGLIAFASRQFAILDLDDVRIGQLSGWTVMSAQEISKINCISGVVLCGSVGYVARLRRSGRRNVDRQPAMRIQFREHATDQRDRACSTKILDPCDSSFMGRSFLW